MDTEIANILVTPFLLFGTNMKFIGAGLAAIGLAGAAMGIGRLFSAHVAGVTGNPAMEKRVFPTTMLGFALTEAAGLFALLVAFLILFT